VVLIGPHKSTCNSSRGQEVLTQFFNLKEVLTFLPLTQASHTLSSLYLMEGSLTTRSLDDVKPHGFTPTLTRTARGHARAESEMRKSEF